MAGRTTPAVGIVGGLVGDLGHVEHSLPLPGGVWLVLLGVNCVSFTFGVLEQR